MGFLRLWLALLVIASHTGLASVSFGIFAVECFFAISGFYMQMILADYLRQPHGVRKFYASRALRIYAPYWAILLVVLVAGIAAGTPKAMNFFDKGNAPDTLVSLWLNLFIVGTEHVKLLRILGNGEAYFWNMILILPVWSVGIELLFYILAPFMLRKLWITAAITAASLTAKAVFLGSHNADIFLLPTWDGLINTIFPLELGIFGIGALAYRFYAAHGMKFQRRKIYPAALAIILLASFALTKIFTLPYGLMLAGWYAVIGAMALALPLLFSASHKKKWDRKIGDLSYAVYLWHLPIYGAVKTLGLSATGAGFFTMALSVLLAIPIIQLVEKPLAHFRHQRFRKRG